MTKNEQRTLPNRKLIAIILTLAMVVAQLAFLPQSVFAADGATVQLVAAEGEDIEGIIITMRQGVVTNTITEAKIYILPELLPGADGTYTITVPGTYSFYSYGEGFYRVLRLFNVYQEQIDNGENIEMVIPNGKMNGGGYEPGNWKSLLERKLNLEIPDTAAADTRDTIIGVYPDEIREIFGVSDTALNPDTTFPYPEGGFDTPGFTQRDEMGMHQHSTEEQAEAYIEDKLAGFTQGTNGVYAYYTSIGETVFFEYNMPLIVFTKDDISECETLDEVADIVRNNDKPTVWHQGGIHGNEPASTEGALVMIGELFGEFGADILDDINVVILPRYNAGGAAIHSRAGWNGTDWNRDHLNVQTPEMVSIHQAFQKFMPEVAIDGHEFDFYRATVSGSSGYMNQSYDLQTTEAGMLNTSRDLHNLSVRLNDAVHQNGIDAGLRVQHYGPAVAYSVGRAYYNMLGTAVVLVEVKGIGGGGSSEWQHFDRRVYSQYTTAKTIYTTAAEWADEFIETSKNAREKLIEWGRTFDPNDEERQITLDGVVTQYTAETTPRLLPQVFFNFDGTQRTPTSTGNLSLGTYYALGRSRTRPTAYVIPNGTPNLEQILEIFDNQLIEYFEVAPGTTVDLRQYYYVSGRLGSSSGANMRADLRDEESVAFPYGAVVVPMDQVNGSVIAMTLEPDVTDNEGYRATLVQQDLMVYDEGTLNFPIYRYEHDNPREMAPAVTKELELTTDAHLIEAGDYFTLNAAFTEEKESNTAILTYNFDGDKFEYAGFECADNVMLVDQAFGEGFAKITVAVTDYKMQSFGDIMLRAKTDAVLKQEYQSVQLGLQYVLRDGDVKTIETAYAGAYFTTFGGLEPVVKGDTNGDGIVDLIDLSNMIDWYGIDDADQEWRTWYVFFDFSNSGAIDIADIAFVAQLIK